MIPASERAPTPTTDFFDKALDLYREAIKMCDKNFGYEMKDLRLYWHVEQLRNTILRHMDSMISNLTHADKIYILSRFDYDLRRSYQNKAIGDIESCIKMCELSNKTLGIKTSRFTIFNDKAEQVITLIKNWRRSDNKILAKMENS